LRKKFTSRNSGSLPQKKLTSNLLIHLNLLAYPTKQLNKPDNTNRISIGCETPEKTIDGIVAV
jgi:hypothetical protein